MRRTATIVTCGCIIYSAVVLILFMVVPPAPAAPTAPPSFTCQAFGSVVECRAKDVGSLDVEWASVWTDPSGRESVYRSAGDSFSFKLHHSGRTVVEMHPGDVTTLRCWVLWVRGRAIFEKWEPHA